MHDHKSYWTKKLYCHTHGHQLTSPQTVKRKTRLLRHIHVRANQSKCGSWRCETPCRQQRTLLARGWRKMAKGRNAKSANTKSDHYWLAGRNPPLKSTPGCLPCGGELFMMRPQKSWMTNDTETPNILHIHELQPTFLKKNLYPCPDSIMPWMIQWDVWNAKQHARSSVKETLKPLGITGVLYVTGHGTTDA